MAAGAPEPTTQPNASMACPEHLLYLFATRHTSGVASHIDLRRNRRGGRRPRQQPNGYTTKDVANRLVRDAAGRVDAPDDALRARSVALGVKFDFVVGRRWQGPNG